jgi:two-component sensor histidine kinase
MTQEPKRGVPLKDLLSVRGLMDDAPLIAEAIVDTVRQPLLLLDATLKVVLANRSFYVTFKVDPAETLDCMVYDLGNGQWNIPRVRELLEDIIPKNSAFFDYEVTHNFPEIGRKVMLLNGKKLRRREGQDDLILLAIEDVTALHQREEELKRLVGEREVLVQEVHHRVKNNLQTIVSLLNLHSGYTDNVHVKNALAEAGGRVQAIARLHERLYASENLSEVNVGDYLRKLVADLQNLHGRHEITFEVATEDIVLDMERATPLALIANELILNCLKHAFPAGRAGHVRLLIQYVPNSVPAGESLDNGLGLLRVEDNGVAFPSGVDAEKSHSMGLTLVRWLTTQLHASSECTVANGVRWTIIFPLAIVQKREETFDRSADAGT